MNARTLTDAELARLTVGAMNSGLRHHRSDLRYSRADADAFAAGWNACKVSTLASVGTVDGVPFVFVTDAQP